MEYTNKIVLVNTNTNEVLVCGGMSAAAHHLSISRDTFKNWFRESKTARKTVNGSSYVMYKADYYIKKR
jgi:hypothetical protein